MDDLKQKARNVKEQHGEKLEGAVDKGSDFAKQRTNGREEQIDSAANKAKGVLRQGKK